MFFLCQNVLYPYTHPWIWHILTSYKEDVRHSDALQPSPTYHIDRMSECVLSWIWHILTCYKEEIRHSDALLRFPAYHIDRMSECVLSVSECVVSAMTHSRILQRRCQTFCRPITRKSVDLRVNTHALIWRIHRYDTFWHPVMSSRKVFDTLLRCPTYHIDRMSECVVSMYIHGYDTVWHPIKLDILTPYSVALHIILIGCQNVFFLCQNVLYPYTHPCIWHILTSYKVRHSDAL